ncbi:MAG: hypothetical protein K0R19_1505 [Bacillota bacterium]|jgi:ABC-type bacteriocin/lantibiotic exporter with double-glycine peptidase domain|nr:hypothetical protein [Bacillota bacterium]
MKGGTVFSLSLKRGVFNVLPNKTIPRELAGMHHSIRFIAVPLCYQETEFTCGAACVQSLLARYGMYFKQSMLADVLNTRPYTGTEYQRILSFVKSNGLTVSFHENLKITDLIRFIDAGIAPLLIIQAWSDDDTDYSHDWKNGHYIIACGYYEKGIYAMDPYTLGYYTYLSFEDLERRWHSVDQSGNRHFHSALIMYHENCPVKYDPSQIKYLG